MSETQKPSYWAIITAEVRYSKDLSDFEKILYSEITSLLNSRRICFASNRYFAELYDKHPKTISRSINKLEKLGYIKVDLIYKNGSKEVLKRLITPLHENVDTPIHENAGTPLHENAEDTNTSLFTINKKSIEKKDLIPSWDEFKSYALMKRPEVCLKDLELKYEAWKENGWKTGMDRKIKNWKSTLLNTLKHLDASKGPDNSFKPKTSDYVR